MNQTTQTDTPLANALRKELCLPASTDDKAIALIVRLERALAKANADKAVLVEALRLAVENLEEVEFDNDPPAYFVKALEASRAALSRVQA